MLYSRLLKNISKLYSDISQWNYQNIIFSVAEIFLADELNKYHEWFSAEKCSVIIKKNEHDNWMITERS